MTATQPQHNVDPRPWRMLPATPAAPLPRRVRTVPGGPRNGWPEPRSYGVLTPSGWHRSRPAADEPLEDGPACTGCGGASVITADRRVRIKHEPRCPVEERLAAIRARRAAAA